MLWNCVVPGLLVLLVKLTATSLFVVFIPQIFPRGNIGFVSEDNITDLLISRNSSGITTTLSPRTTTATTMKTQVTLRPTWERYSGSDYWFSEGMLAWISSRMQCKKQGSDLAIINDQKELEFLYNKTERGDYYIGLSLENGMTWLWNDRTELERILFTLSTDIEKECGAISTREVIPVSCSQKRHWICEKKL